MQTLLLLSKDESYLVTNLDRDLSFKSGIVRAKELKKKKFGDTIKTHIGKEFYVVRPSILDILYKGAKRAAQVILPKDIGLILSYTGIRPDSKVVDAGAGTGFLSIFMANMLPHGEVVTYEKDKRFFEVARKNIEVSGLANLSIKLKDVNKGIPDKNVDLVTLDMQHPGKAISHAYKALKMGGYIAVYSPTAEELIDTVKVVRKLNFSEPKTVENIVREWQTERTTRPKTMGLMHTGWLTFARKVG